MVVPNIRNPNRYRTQPVAKPTKSQYHLEPDLTASYKHVGRRTKGGTGGGGGGYLYSSGGYRSNGTNGNNDNAVWNTIIPIILVLGFIIGICFCACKKSDRFRNQNHSNMRTTRNNVYRQRSQRAVAPVNNNTASANAIQFHTAPQVYNSPSSTPERHINMKPFFYFQTVLPDKSNLDPHVLREEAMMEHTGASDDDDSVIEGENGDPPGKKGVKNAKYSVSSRFLMSTWRRPTANDECSICLQSYKPGQSICLAKNTECKHVFHQDCIEEWLKDHSECPLCRVNIMYKPP